MLDKLLANITDAERKAFLKVLGKDEPEPTLSVDEQTEAHIEGIRLALKSLKDHFKAHPMHDHSEFRSTLDILEGRMFDLLMTSTWVKRRKEAGLL